MPPLQTIFPTLPWPMIEIIIKVVGLLGAILLSYGVLLESERRQDTVFMIGSASLLVYALVLNNKIFMLAMAGMFLISLWEIIEIARGKHHHTVNDMQKYEHFHNN